MKKTNTWKKLLVLAFVAVLALSVFAGCGSSDTQTAANAGSQSTSGSGSNGNAGSSGSGDSGSGAAAPAKSHKIAVFTLKATGSIVEAVEAYLGTIADDLGFTYEVRFAGDDAATLLSNVEGAIAEGFEGIVSMTDKGNNAAILELCEDAGVYFGGTWSNQGSSLNSSDAGYDILKSASYVGSLADGNDAYNAEVAEFAKDIAALYEELPEAEKEGSIGITTNPSKWTPGHQIAAQKMYEALTEDYGIPESAFATATIEKRATDETYAGTTLPAGTWQFPQVDASSRQLPSAYFQSNSNLKLICSFASITYIEPALQTAGIHGKVKVWTCGYEAEDYLLNNFGSLGDSTYQGFRTAPIEDVVYPIVQMLDKLNGNSYADREAKVAELTEAMGSNPGAKFQLKNYLIPYSSSIIVTTDAQFESFKTHYVYGDGNGTDNIASAEQLKQLMVTFNPEATYEQLVAFFDESGSLTVDAIG